MDKTILTLAVDSSQVGTAAAALDRMTGAGNAAASAGAKVTASATAQGKALSQTAEASKKGKVSFTDLAAAAEKLSPRAMAQIAAALGQTASEAGKASTAVLSLNRAVAATPQITVTSAAPATRTPLAAPAPAGVTTGVAVPAAALAGDVTRAQTAIERLTAAARNDRNALVQLAPAVNAASVSYRQLASTPIRLTAEQGLSAASAALVSLSNRANGARRAIADLGRVVPVASVAQPAQAATPALRTGNTAPSAAAATALAAATTRGTAAVNAFTAAEGRATEASQHLAEANVRNEAAQARLAAAIQRATVAQAAFDNVSRSGSGSANAIAAAQARLQSAQAAVSTATANVARTQRAATDAAERHRTALASVGRQSTLTAAQTVQLHYQLHDFFVQVAAGQSPLTALIQQGSQLSGTFGGAGGAFRAVMSLLTPLRLALGGAAGAVAAVGYAFYEGAKQSKAFADAVVLTGNYAGQTQGKLTALTREIAAQGQVTASAAREAAQAAISTGQIGPQVFAQATEAIALYAKVTDKSAEDVARDFADMARTPSKWAEEHNRALNFITAAQYDAIKAFEDGGKAADAQAVIYNALTERLKKLDPNLGTIERTLRSVKNAWSNFWDAAYDIGRTDTIEGKIASLDAKIRKSRTDSNPFAPAPQSRTAQLAKANQGEQPSDEYQLQDLLAGKARKDADALNEANDREVQKAGIAAKAVVDGYLKRGKAASAYKEALDKLNQSFKDQQAAGTPVSAADQKVALTELKKEFTPAKAAGAGEAQQVLRAQLETDIKGIKDALDAEKERLSFQQRYLDGVYQAGQVSLKDFYNTRRATIAEGVEAELAELDKEAARLEKYKKDTKDPSEKVVTQTRINEVQAQKEKIATAASHDVVLVNQEEAASFKALAEQVVNYRANLLQMQGDEAGAAALRAQTVIQNARLLAAQAKNLPGAAQVDVSGLARAIAITDQFNEVQRQAGLLSANSSRAEEAYALAAEQSGKSLVETERGIYAVRVTELAQLGDLAQKAKELADASTDPRIKAFAADLALEYAKAANAIDPALNRLRDANRELAAGLSQTVGNAPNAFVEFYSQRRRQSEQDIKAQKDEYDKRIDQLRGYLSQEKDERNKATLKKRIDQLQGESDGLKVESKGKSALESIKKTVLEPMAQQISASISKILIEAPLQKYIEGQLKGLTEGDGALAGIFKDALGIKADPKQQALLQQTAAITASSTALDALKLAAENAANALNKPLSGVQADNSSAPGATGAQPVPVDAELAGAGSDAAESLASFGKQAASTASDVVKLANAAGAGGDAMGRLPGIIGLFQSAVAAMSTNGGAGGGGFLSSLTSLFGGSSGGAGYEEAVALTGVFHQGGVIGNPPAQRAVLPSLFANAPRYHTGGIVGKLADKRAGKLARDEVAAILMGGPKGKREEVLHASDPRHRDNLGMGVLARIMAESKAGLKVRGARELGGPVSPDSLYRVNEKGPELLQVAGKQYLMMGSQGGKVEPNVAKAGAGKTIHINVQVTAQPGMSRATAQQQGAQVAKALQNALRRND